MFTSYGTLVYDPTMDGQKVKEPFWLVVKCDDGISYYYAHMLYKWNGTKIHRPAWGTHISLIRNESVQNKELWKADEGLRVRFDYSPEIQTNGNHFWLTVFSHDLLAIRKRFGLPNPFYPLHLTLGSIIS